MHRSACLIAVVLLVACAAPPPAQEATGPPLPAEVRIDASELQLFHSERAGARYLVSVALPDAPTGRVPAVYVIGEAETFELVAETSRVLARGSDARASLVVGVERDDLQRSTDDARLLAFLTDELAPYVATRYAVSDEKLLVGDRGGAAFALYALFTAPRSFAGYLINPGPWPRDDRTLQREATYAEHEADLAARVFLATGGLDPEAARVEELTRLLRTRHYPQLEIETVIFHGETRSSSVPAALSRGLRFVLGQRAARDASNASTSTGE